MDVVRRSIDSGSGDQGYAVGGVFRASMCLVGQSREWLLCLLLLSSPKPFGVMYSFAKLLRHTLFVTARNGNAAHSGQMTDDPLLGYYTV